jgi:hypothetical protein
MECELYEVFQKETKKQIITNAEGFWAPVFTAKC